MLLLALACGALLSGPFARPASAQSLADLARQEEARRKAVKDSGKVYTNKDLPNIPAPPPSVEPVPSDAAATDAKDTGAAAPSDKKDAAATEKAAEAGKSSDASKSKDEPKGETYWRARMTTLQTQFDRDQAFSAALQTQINSLTADFISRDDPAQKAVIAENRQKALDEFARLQDAIKKDQTAISDLDDEARRANVPAGWLR